MSDTLLDAAIAHHRQGRLDEAARGYADVLAREPAHFDALCMRADALLGLGRPNEALAAAEAAVAAHPRSPQPRVLRGRAHFHADALDAALADFDFALRLDPRQLEARFYRGIVLMKQERFAAAADAFRRVVAAEPDNLAALNNLGSALQEVGKAEEALPIFERLLALDPHNALLHYNRAHVLADLKHYDESLAACELALRAGHPRPEKVHLLRAADHQHLGQPEAAQAAAEDALRRDLTMVKARIQRALALWRQNRCSEARDELVHARRFVPDDPEIDWTEALVALHLGDYAEGWALYEARWKVPELRLPPRPFLQPLWLGEAPLAGRTILLHAEQGFGDTLQSLRYVPLVKALGARVLLEVQPALRSLCERLAGVDALFVPGDALPAFDLHCPLMSLPHAFRTTLETVPAEVPYLAAGEERLARWRERLGPLAAGRRRRIGLVWAGNPNQVNDRMRSAPLSALQPLLARRELEFCTLQKEISAADRAQLAEFDNVRVLDAELADFSDTAAIASLCDLIVSIDTGVAHLVGALGRPTCLMLAFHGDWRYLLERSDSPWYPSFRIYRQSAPGDWAGLVDRLVGDLDAQPAPTSSAEALAAADATLTAADALATADAALAGLVGDLDAQPAPASGAEALAAADAALAAHPHSPQPRVERGLAHFHAGALDTALADFDHALRLDPRQLEARFYRGVVLMKQERFGAAADAFRRVVAAEPDNLAALNNLGSALQEARKPAEALPIFEQLLAREPENPLLHYNRAHALTDLERYDESLAACRAALACGHPAPARVHLLIGINLRQQHRVPEAQAAAEEALRLEPTLAKARIQRAVALLRQNRCREAREELALARQYGPDEVELDWTEAIVALTQGDFERGWALYEARWRTPELGLEKRPFFAPQWLGDAPLAGRTILLHAEQGFGDTLQVVRYAPLVQAMGARVLLEVQPPLKSLFDGAPGIDQVFARGEPLPPFDLHCPLMSLPLAFGTTLSTIPAAVPYVRVAAPWLDKWRARLAPAPGGAPRPRIGLVWAGNPKNAIDRIRSVPLAALRPLLARRDVEFCTLQKEINAADRAQLAEFDHVRILDAELADFSDTAAIASLCDLIVSIDTGVAHLAGALGRPTSLMLAYQGDWRYLLERSDSPWYPSFTIYRQSAPGDWSGLVERLVRDLDALVAAA